MQQLKNFNILTVDVEVYIQQFSVELQDQKCECSDVILHNIIQFFNLVCVNINRSSFITHGLHFNNEEKYIGLIFSHL